MLDLAWLGVSSRRQVQPIACKRQVAMIEYLEEAARLPDKGIWEVRGPRRHSCTPRSWPGSRSTGP
jgi:hypothetical protein